MVQQVILTDSTGAISVNLSNYHVSVGYRYTNPVIIIPTPKSTPGASNQYSLNLTMSMESVDLSFVLPPTGGGCGDFNFATGTTDFEKLGRIAQSKGKAKLTINNAASKSCSITAFTTTWEPGMKDLSIGCRMSLVFGVK